MKQKKIKTKYFYVFFPQHDLQERFLDLNPGGVIVQVTQKQEGK
jgi:hypothetical protein